MVPRNLYKVLQLPTYQRTLWACVLGYTICILISNTYTFWVKPVLAEITLNHQSLRILFLTQAIGFLLLSSCLGALRQQVYQISHESCMGPYTHIWAFRLFLVSNLDTVIYCSDITCGRGVNI